MGQDDQDTTTTTDPVEELTKRLELARASRERAEASRRARFAVDDLQRQVEREEQAAQDTAAIEELEAKHGREGVDIAVVRTSYGAVVVKKPSRLRYTRFVDAGKHNLDNVETLVKECLLHPSKASFNAICDKETDTIRRCGNAIGFLHGIRIKEELPGK